MFKTVRMPFFSAEGGGGDVDLTAGKTFTQEDVERIIGERLSRERASKVDYDDLKEMADLVKEFGYQGSAAEIKSQLKQEADQRRQAVEIQKLKEEAATSGTSPEILAEIKALQKKIDEFDKDKQEQQKEHEQKRAADEAWAKQVGEFHEKYPDVDMDKLAENEKFSKFFGKANPNVPFVEIYEDYIDLVGGAEKAAIEKIQSNAERSTSSGRAKGDPAGGSHGLSDSQKRLADQNSMSYKEYAELLKDIQN